MWGTRISSTVSWRQIWVLIAISPEKYFKARLQHYSWRFATFTEYLFAQCISEQTKLSDSINIALKKVHGHICHCFSIKSQSSKVSEPMIKHMYFQEHHHTGKNVMYKVIAMVKQLGIPIWFMTLSCAHLRWPELLQILTRIQGNDLTDKQNDALSCNGEVSDARS